MNLAAQAILERVRASSSGRVAGARSDERAARQLGAELIVESARGQSAVLASEWLDRNDNAGAVGPNGWRLRRP